MEESLVICDPYLTSNILINLDYDDIINYCNSNEKAFSLRNNNKLWRFFWQLKSFHSLGVSEKLFNQTNIDLYLDSDLRYLQLASLLKKDVSLKSLHFISMDEFVTLAIKKEKWDLFAYAIKNNFNNWKLALSNLAEINNDYYLKILLERFKDYQYAAIGAIKGKNIDLFKNLYKSNYDYNWNYNLLLAAALDINDTNLVDFIYNNAPKFYYWQWITIVENLDLKNANQNIIDKIKNFVNDSDLYMVNLFVIKSGHIDIFNPILTTPKYLSFLASYANNNLGVLKYILSLAPINYNFDWNIIITGNIKLYDYIKTLMPKNYILNFNTTAIAAIKIFNKELFDQIFLNGPTDYKWKWNTFLRSAVRSVDISKLASIADEDIKLINYIIFLAPHDYQWDWNRLAIFAVDNNKIFKHIMNIAPTNYQWDWNWILSSILEVSNRDLLEHVLPKINQYYLNADDIAETAAYDKYLFIQLLPMIKKYKLDLLKLIKTLTMFSFSSVDYYDTLEYILSNNIFTFNNYVDIMSNSYNITTFNMIGKHLPTNFDLIKLIQSINVNHRIILLNKYVNSMKNISSFDIIINKINNNEIIYYDENTLLKRQAPFGSIYLTFYIDDFYTALLSATFFNKYMIHPLFKKVKFN